MLLQGLFNFLRIAQGFQHCPWTVIPSKTPLDYLNAALEVMEMQVRGKGKSSLCLVEQNKQIWNVGYQEVLFPSFTNASL